MQLFRERGQLTLPEIREARICSPSHTFNLLNQLTDEQVIEKPQGSRGVYVLRAS
ncbi:hypothetical protein ACFQX6_65775 [Streptosporangium lutulentum]